jgi:hypothetical protein
VKTWLLKLAYWFQRTWRFSGDSLKSTAKCFSDPDELTVEEMKIDGRTLLVVRFCFLQISGEGRQMEALGYWRKLKREGRR